MSTQDSLAETSISSTLLVEGLLLKAWRDEVRLPNGHTAIREYIRHPGAVIMVPILPNGNTVLVRQFRYPCRRSFLELPAGKLDAGEAQLDAARRELSEEIGYEAGHLELLAEYYPCIGYSDEKMWLYLATDLKATTTRPDHDEFLERHELPLPDAVLKIWSGEIQDLKSIAGLLFAQRRIQTAQDR